jgi:hypothetical protein
MLGVYTTLRVIHFPRSGELRFSELQRALGDANSVTLTNRRIAWRRPGSSSARKPHVTGYR